MIFTAWAALAIWPSALQGESNHLKSDTAQVDVNLATPINVVPAKNAQSQPMTIGLKYAFKDRDTVWLEGVGTLPAKGDLDYVIRTDKLVFRDKKGGASLAAVPVVATTIPLSGPPIGDPYPSLNDKGWQPAGQAMQLAADPSKISHLLYEVLGTPSNSPFLSFQPCSPVGDGCGQSMWSTITSPIENLQIQVALEVIYVQDKNNAGKTNVKLQYEGRQALRGSVAWNYSLDSDTFIAIAAKLHDFNNLLGSIH